MVLDYIVSVENFVKEHKQKLSQHETEIWKEKARVTVQSVVDCLGYVPSHPYGGLDDFVAEHAIKVPMKDDGTEELVEKDAAVDSSHEEESGFSHHVEAFEKPKEENVVPQVQEILDAVKSQEFLLENLPSVPIEVFDDENSFDKNIEERLLRLKFFDKLGAPSSVTKLNHRRLPLSWMMNILNLRENFLHLLSHEIMFAALTRKEKISIIGILNKLVKFLSFPTPQSLLTVMLPPYPTPNQLM